MNFLVRCSSNSNGTEVYVSSRIGNGSSPSTMDETVIKVFHVYVLLGGILECAH